MNFLFSIQFPLFSVKMRTFFKSFLIRSKGGKASKNVLIRDSIILFLIFCPLFVKPIQAQTSQVVNENIFCSSVLWEFRENTEVKVNSFTFKAFDEFNESSSEKSGIRKKFFMLFSTYLEQVRKIYLYQKSHYSNAGDSDADDSNVSIIDIMIWHEPLATLIALCIIGNWIVDFLGSLMNLKSH